MFECIGKEKEERDWESVTALQPVYTVCALQQVVTAFSRQLGKESPRPAGDPRKSKMDILELIVQSRHQRQWVGPGADGEDRRQQNMQIN